MDKVRQLEAELAAARHEAALSGFDAQATSDVHHHDGVYLASALRQTHISVRGARTHNLKNIDRAIS